MAIELPPDHPPIANVTQTARAFALQQLGWRLWLIAAAVAAWLALGIWLTLRWGLDDDLAEVFLYTPLLLGGLYWTYLLHKVRQRFWQQFAHAHGYSYLPKGDPKAEAAVMFHQGHRRKMHHVIGGKVDDRRLRIFSYEFTVGHGRSSTTYPYTVFEFRFDGHFPHLYLNQLFNRYGVKVGEAIPLPAEFEKTFTLRAPKEYEIEALQVFTPDLLAYLLDSGLKHDVEIVAQELLIFTAGYVNTVDDLEREFADAVALAKRLAPKLDRFRFTPIGSLSPTLTQP